MPADYPQSALDLLTLPASDFVDASYFLLLGRHPGPSEISEQSGSLRGGIGRLRFLADLSLSTEYRTRHSANSGTSDTAFLEDLYMRYLGRPIDPQGMERYLRMLSRGKTRKRIARDIGRSREARAKRTLWFELDRMLADEQAERHWLKRWQGRTRRRERRENRIYEAALRNSSPPSVHAVTLQNAPSPAFLDFDLAHARTGLSREARHVLARVRAIRNASAGRA